jgi:hypothetical protein
VAGRLHAHTGLLDWRRPNDLAIAALDAAGLGSCGRAIRIHRAALVGAFWEVEFDHDCAAWRNQYSVLRGDGAQDPLVAIQWLPHDFIYAVVHHSGRVRDCTRLRVACANTATRLVAHRGCRWDRRWNLDFRLLCRGVSDYRRLIK